MQPWTLLLRCLVVIGIPGGSARRGGGGGRDGDSNNDSDGGGSGGGDSPSGDEHCGTPDHPPVWKWDLIPLNAQNSTRSNAIVSDYGGSFFKGEASLDFIITSGKKCSLNDMQSTHMLGYAWIGPQASYPVGPTNPIIIGFKAWGTDKSLDEISDSYTYVKWSDLCPRKPDLFRLTTTHGWSDFAARTSRAADFMNMKLTESGDLQRQVLFNATMAAKLQYEPGDEGLSLSLPQGTCTSSLGYQFRLPDQLAMHGSFTNETLNLTLSGRGNATARKRGDELTAEFTIHFLGVFDADNSTQRLSLQQRGEPLVSWVKNFGLRATALDWASSIVYIAALVLSI